MKYTYFFKVNILENLKFYVFLFILAQVGPQGFHFGVREVPKMLAAVAGAAVAGAAAAAATSQELCPSGKAPGPSRAGSKYPVWGSLTSTTTTPKRG